MSDIRLVRLGSVEKRMSTDALWKLYERGELPVGTRFYSESRKAWLPITRILSDIYPFDFAMCRRVKVKRILWQGVTPNDCPACAPMDGKSFLIDEVPEFPPLDCTCQPWCRCLLIADFD